MTPVLIRIPTPLATDLSAMARQIGESRNALITEALAREVLAFLTAQYRTLEDSTHAHE